MPTIDLYELNGIVHLDGNPAPASGLIALAVLQLAKQNNVVMSSTALAEILSELFEVLVERFDTVAGLKAEEWN